MRRSTNPYDAEVAYADAMVGGCSRICARPDSSIARWCMVAAITARAWASTASAHTASSSYDVTMRVPWIISGQGSGFRVQVERRGSRSSRLIDLRRRCSISSASRRRRRSKGDRSVGGWQPTASAYWKRWTRTSRATGRR
jgi:hypothetical protein